MGFGPELHPLYTKDSQNVSEVLSWPARWALKHPTATSTMEAPINPGNMADGELRLELASFGPHAVHKVPAYHS